MNNKVSPIVFIFFFISISVDIYCWDQGGAFPEFVVENGFAYITDSVSLYCLDIQNKSIKWSYKPLLHFALPDNYKDYNFAGITHFIKDNKRIFLGTKEGYLVCINANNGEMQWEYFLNNTIITKPQFKNQKLFLGTDGFKVISFDLIKQDTIWTYKINSKILNLIVEDKVYFSASDCLFYSVKIEDGKYVWMSHEFHSQPLTRPIFYKDNIYLGSVRGTVYNIKSQNGGTHWFTEGSQNFGEACYPVIIDNHIIYKHLKEALVSFDIKKLNGKFRFDGDNILPYSVIANDSMLYYIGDSKLYIANAVTGLYRNPIYLGLDDPSTPVLIGDTMFLKNKDEFYIFNINTEKLEKIFDIGILRNSQENIIKLNIENLKLVASQIIYPEIARNNNIEGVVTFRCLVDEQGKILVKFCEYNDNDYLMEATKEAIEKTTLNEIIVNNEQYKGWISISVPFILTNPKK